MRLRKIEFNVSDTGCFEVTSHKPNSKSGYYRVGSYHNRILLHRKIYEECFGYFDDSLLVRHKCDNPKCINPEHLELGTHQDNSNDAVSRNRMAKNEKSGVAKFTNDEVRYIKHKLNNGVYGTEIAKEFDVGFSTIYAIKKGITWKDVN
ncbi:DNA binding protein [Bacillus phage vB_BthS_BMBphi]|nr:DNA binding protein [Bacillus phage vB_BthS_BMBphi]